MEREEDLEEIIERKARRRAGKSNQYTEKYTTSKKRGGDKRANEVICGSQKDLVSTLD